MTNIPKLKLRSASRKTARGRKTPQASAELTPAPAADTTTQPAPQQVSIIEKKSPTRKRVRIGDALRKSGVDEWAIAGGYAHVFGKLTRKSSDDDDVPKLFVDVLKEVSRHLEPARSEAAPDAPVIVKLVHQVARPTRTPAGSS